MPGPSAVRTPAVGVRAWLPGVLALTGVACTAVAVALGTWFDGTPVYGSDAVMGLLYPPVAALVLRREPGTRIGRLLLTTAVFGPYLLAGQYVQGPVLEHGWSGPLGGFAVWLTAWGFTPYFVVLALVPLFFPTGTLPSPRWRPFARVLVAAVAVTVLATMVRRYSDFTDAVTNPLSVTSGDLPEHVLRLGSQLTFLVGAPAGVAALVLRMRRARGMERTQLQWLTLGVTVLVLCTLGSFALDATPASDAVFALGFAAVPVSVAIAVLRHGLFDVGLVVSRALVFTVLSVLLLVAYVGFVALVGEISAGERRIAVAAAAIAALAAAAGWERAQRGVDRLLYGERRDPLAVATRVGSSLDLAGGPVDALQALVDEVARALRLPRVSVVPADPRLAAVTSAGAAPEMDVEVFGLTALGTRVGELRICHRSPGERWRRTERAAFDDVARRAAVLVWAAELVDDLQVSRERIVAGREEERRRLRHDLHDGVGPELAGMALQLERLAGKLAGGSAGGPADSAVHGDRRDHGDLGDLAALAGRLRDQMRRTVAAVRRAVDDLRPPALDELGLVGALREHVAAYRMTVAAGGPGRPGDDGGATVTVVAPDLPPLRAAVEVAAYRIATEAVANAVRHAGATTCWVRLAVTGDALLVEITDDGLGIDPGAVSGVGSTSMRERAAELGGSLEIDSAPGEGTTVRTRLPLATS
ncbi:sensor histidine kinase [Trujillonella endophytica]|uniref:Oxygen sensor histidine kinase NreB n=1 Tax=Trujillonella endophytica TaxID=673521 RepID=A0A1H8VLT0_9ACTN|nr:sensor histidine kinase [Trujillella endophytica]SEP15818.1 Histidine kinase [Trujillella endophytica]